MSFKQLAVGALAATAVLPKLANAHCPLCVGAVGGAVAAASFFGFNPAVIGVFAGAFGIVSGQWIAKWIPKKYVPFQSEAVTLGSFALTILPSMNAAQRELFVPLLLFGEPGTFFNQVHWVNLLLLGAVIGGAAVFGADWVAKKVKATFGVRVPFQSIAVIVLLLSLVAGAMQLVLGG